MNKELRSGPRHFFRLFLIKRLLLSSLKKNACVLDAGSGGGELTIELAREGLRVDAFDADKKSCDYLAERLRGGNLRERIRIINKDFSQLDYPPHFFDAIVCSEVLEHIDDDKGLLKYFQSILKPGGILIVSTPLKGKGWDKWDELAGHKRLYEPAVIFSMLRAAGFEVEKHYSWGVPFGRIYHKMVLLVWGNKRIDEEELFAEKSIITRIGKNKMISALLSGFLFLDLVFPPARGDIGIIIKAAKKT